MKIWQHNELAEDLADIKNTNFLDIPLGSVWLERPQRADVVEVKPSYTRFCVSIYEIKISRSDFLSDIRSGKWRGYLDHCHRFYFAAPKDMVTKNEIPEEAGLIVRGETGWSTIKAAPVRHDDIPYTTLLSLIFAKQRLNHSKHGRKAIADCISYNYWKRDNLYKKLGKELGDALRHRDEYIRAKENFEYEIKQIRQCIKDGLGKDDCWPTWALAELVQEIKQKQEAMLCETCCSKCGELKTNRCRWVKDKVMEGQVWD